MSAAAGSNTSASGDGGHQHIHVHPVVLLSVADHYTRTVEQTKIDRAEDTAMADSSRPQVLNASVGAILGTQNENEVHISFASDLRLVPAKQNASSPWKIDIEYLQKQAKLNSGNTVTDVHPEAELLGWYIASQEELDPHLLMFFHHQLKELNENPLLLMLDPQFDEAAKELPISIYNSKFDASHGKGEEILVKVPYKIDITEAERSTINNVSNASTNKEGRSSATETIKASEDALKMFRNRTNDIIKYLTAVKEGKLKGDPQLLRSIEALSKRLPVLHTPFIDNVLDDIDVDTELISLLSTLTKVGKHMSEALDKHEVSHYRASTGGSMDMSHLYARKFM